MVARSMYRPMLTVISTTIGDGMTKTMQVHMLMIIYSKTIMSTR